MSKSQIFSGISPVKSAFSVKTLPIKFIPILKKSSKKVVRIQKYPNSKSRGSIFLNNSSNSISKINSTLFETINTDTEKLKKQMTISTDCNSSIVKDLLPYETKLNKALTEENPKNKYLICIELWKEIIAKECPTICELLFRLKDEIEKYALFLEIELENLKELNKYHEETRHTLKILKKRFQKLAFENREINNLIIEKENDYIRKKIELKEKTKEFNALIREKEETIKKLEIQCFELRKSQNISEVKYQNNNVNQGSQYKETQGYPDQIIKDNKEEIKDLNNLSSILIPDEGSLLQGEHNLFKLGSSFLNRSELDLIS